MGQKQVGEKMEKPKAGIIKVDFREKRKRRDPQETTPPKLPFRVLLEVRKARTESFGAIDDISEANNAYRRRLILIALKEAGIQGKAEKVIAALEPRKD